MSNARMYRATFFVFSFFAPCAIQIRPDWNIVAFSVPSTATCVPSPLNSHVVSDARHRFRGIPFAVCMSLPCDKHTWCSPPSTLVFRICPTRPFEGAGAFRYASVCRAKSSRAVTASTDVSSNLCLLVDTLFSRTRPFQLATCFYQYCKTPSC